MTLSISSSQIHNHLSFMTILKERNLVLAYSLLTFHRKLTSG